MAVETTSCCQPVDGYKSTISINSKCKLAPSNRIEPRIILDTHRHNIFTKLSTKQTGKLILNSRTKLKRLIFNLTSVLVTSYLIYNLVISTATTRTKTNAKYGVRATASVATSLPQDRYPTIRQIVSSSYKQTKKNHKEINEKIILHVKENTPIGTRLTEIQVKDSDYNQQSLHPSLSSNLHQPLPSDLKIIYDFSYIGDFQSFTLRKNEHDGKVELVNEVNFDYESPKKSYTLEVVAIAVPFRYELEIDILIEDENDNQPQLSDFAIVFNNYRNHFPTGPIGRVPATDLDVNDVLRYRVLSGNNARLIVVNETNGDILLSPWLNSNVPFKAVMEIGVTDGINDASAKLVLSVNLITESMLHSSVVLRFDGISRDDFLSKKYDNFQNQMARILGTSNLYAANDIVVFDVEQSSSDAQQAVTPQQQPSVVSTGPSEPVSPYRKNLGNLDYSFKNGSMVYINVSFSARAEGNDAEAYLSRQYIEERIFLNRIALSDSLDAQVTPFQDDICVDEPCQNYQECQVIYKFDKAPKTFYTNRNMIFRQIKTSQSYTCLCPNTFTGMKYKLECNLQINQCFSNPCLNGGLCHRHELGFTCECRGEFFGPRCEHSFTNSTCQSISGSSRNGQTSSNLIQTTADNEYLASSSNPPTRHPTASSMCSGKSRCVNLNKSHQYYYQKLAPSSSSISAASSGLTGGFACQGCPFSNQWSTDLCQLRARSFDKQAYIVLPSLRRRHRFNLAMQFNTVESDALLLYNGRYNDRHDFIAIEIVNSRLKFSYSLGQSGQIFCTTLSTIPVSDGQWHKVTVDYRDRNVTLILDDCDPVLDEALARLQSITSRRCSNTTTARQTPNELPGANTYRMLDLTGPMYVGAIPANLNPPGPNSESSLFNESAHIGLLASGFTGCLRDLHFDHQLVDLSSPLLDFGSQPGCPEKQNLCQQTSCNGHSCQDSYGHAKCQCSEERLGRSCELFLSQERARKFTGNSYLAYNPTETVVPNRWQISLHFRTLNPSGILFKIFLDSHHSVLLEVMNSGLKLTHRSRSLFFNKIQVDDGEWHYVELVWFSGDGAQLPLTTLQVDYNPNLSVSTSDFDPVSGAAIRMVVVGFSSTRFTSSMSSYLSPPSASVAALTTSNNPQESPIGQESVADFGSSLLTVSTVAPSATTASAVPPSSLVSEQDYYGNSSTSSQSFVGCIYGLNISDNGEWPLSPIDELNVERGCPLNDPCEMSQCPANSRCTRKGVNQRKCLCNPGFVGDFCLPVCDLQPCQGENSKCIPSVNQEQNFSTTPYSNRDLNESQQHFYTCECDSKRSGTNCEHQLSQGCPSNWWGRPLLPGQNSSICGPCNCDESKGFDGDCDKLTGQCFCKANHYKPANSDLCLACDCYAVGSLSTSCDQTSGQCKCQPGVVGRRCDTCAGPLAEVTSRGCEVIYDACPKTFSDGIWWDKTQIGRLTKQPCPPSTSTGTAERYCNKTDGWHKPNMFNCISNTFTDLHTQYQFLDDNKYQMSTDLAMKIANNLRQALNETISNPSMQLYGSDMYISFRLLHHLIQHESQQTGLNLTHRQDRAYIRNMVESISYILDPVYAENWPEIAARSPDGGAEYLLKLLDNYGKILIDSQSDTYTQPFEVASKHLTFGMDKISIDQLYDPSKWSLSGGLNPSGIGGGFAQTNHFPSSPPYATDPFDPPFSSSVSRQNGIIGEQTNGGNFNPDGTSIYLDFSATRESSPSIVMPKYDNYPSAQNSLIEFGGSHQNSKVFIPLKALRMRTPKEIIGSVTGPSWSLGAARSRAKRDELIIPDYASIRNHKQPIVVYSIFKTIGTLLPTEYDNTVQNRLGMLALANSPVVWLTMRPQNSTEFVSKNIQPKITYMLKVVEPMGKTRPQCATWDFGQLSALTNTQKNSSSPQPVQTAYGRKKIGRFTTRGCELKGVYSNYRSKHKYEYVNCSCDHTGAITVLMYNSNGNFDYLTNDDSRDLKDMSLIIVLCISLVILTIILIVLTCIRGHSIKSNSNSINKNLIVILIILELIFMYMTLSKTSLIQREYQCKLVAIFLDYFSISLFFWLLVNAIHFYRMLTELRDINHGPMKFYHVLGYAVPAFFVSIAVGLRIEQFGNYLFCWLSIHEPIIWSMFGPISMVSVLAFILFILALSKSLPLKKMMAGHDDPNGLDLIRTHMLINSIKTPLIGLYWLVAVYAINETLIDYVYVFPLTILIKSIVLFILLCVIDRYIRYNLYVSWLRFKGEKVPFVDDSMMSNGHYGLVGNGNFTANHGSQQWMISMMNSPDGATGYGGLVGGFDMKNQTGQMLYPTHQQVITPGFQSSCTDIFRPELLDGLSAASTTSRSSATGTSSSAAYREHRRGRHHRGLDDELDREDMDEFDDYGRTRRHRRRHGIGGKKSHRKHHHHHHHSGRHHHHHHHHHRHRSHHQDDYEVNGREEDELDYGRHAHSHSHHHHHHRSHRHKIGASGHSGHLNHDRSDSTLKTNDSQHDSLDNIINNDELLASSHSSDRDDTSMNTGKPKKSTIYSTEKQTAAEHQSRQTKVGSKDQVQVVEEGLKNDCDDAKTAQDTKESQLGAAERQTVPMELINSSAVIQSNPEQSAKESKIENQSEA